MKRAAWQALCHAAYWSGVGPLLARLRRRPGSWTVLTYHRVGPEDARGPGPDIVGAERFRAQLRWLRHRYEVLPVGEALARLENGASPSHPIASITFDDGYADNVAVALPILREEGCRASLYLTVEAVEEGLPPWTHRLAADLQAMASGGWPLNERRDALHPLLRSWLVEPSADAARTTIGSILGQAKDLDDASRARLSRDAERLSGGAGRRAAPMIDAGALRAWRDAGMEVGSHTLRHRVLARLTREDRRLDLAESRRRLEAMIGVPVLHLAYPNGGPGDWDAATQEDAAAAGYRSAATTFEGENRGRFDRLAIRRFPGAADSIPVFAMRLSGLFNALRAPFKSRRAAETTSTGMRIAFIGGRGVGSAYSGIERYYEEVGSRLVARGHRVVAYARVHFTPDVASFRGVEVRRIPTLRMKHLETMVHSILATIDVCFRRVDLVQYHALGSSPLAWIPRLAGKKTIVSVRGLDWQRAKWGALARFYLRFCEVTSVRCPNATAVVSRTLARHFAEAHGVAVRFIPNGVEHPPRRSPSKIREFGVGDRDYFLYAGRLSPEKGLECLIEAHRRAATGVRLVIAGGTSYSDRYIGKIRALAGPEVVFTGFVTGETLEELYGNALAFVLPSHMEGLSVALLEALSYGLPPITSDIPENRELVDACGGYVFPIDDVGALAALMGRLAADRDGARRLGDQCRERVRAQFGWDEVAEATERFYLEVLHRTGRQPAAPPEETPAVPSPAERDARRT
jgi:glycosyltransferase involved in cell wall biosynthesis/peptidoglycan/xylan/chitin deacetylase (PgdA/CDA1 family)